MSERNFKYYRRELGGIVSFDGYIVYCLNENGEWISNDIIQSAVIPMFIEKNDILEEISESEVQKIIVKRKKHI